MPPTYHVKDWDRIFETSETRKLKHLYWVPIPNKHDGKGYHRLMTSNPLYFAAWILVLQVASRCSQRGLLEDQEGPLTPEDLEAKTHLPAKIFQAALSRLVEIGWMELLNSEGLPIIAGEFPVTSGKSPGRIELNGTELNGTELNGTKRTEQKKEGRFAPPTQEEVAEFIKEKNYHFTAEEFIAYYGSQGWLKANGRKVTNWKQCCVTFEKNEFKRSKSKYNLPGDSLQYGRGGIALPTESDLVMSKRKKED
jgi:hypothetical protein